MRSVTTARHSRAVHDLNSPRLVAPPRRYWHHRRALGGSWQPRRTRSRGSSHAWNPGPGAVSGSGVNGCGPVGSFVAGCAGRIGQRAEQPASDAQAGFLPAWPMISLRTPYSDRARPRRRPAADAVRSCSITTPEIQVVLPGEAPGRVPVGSLLLARWAWSPEEGSRPPASEG